MRLVPAGWKTFQHYSKRRPPWVKLHRSILDNRDYVALPLASKALAPLLWLLASEDPEGEFDASVNELSFRLRMTPKEIESGLKPLIESGFFVDASNALAECLQHARPERERERETKAEGERKQKSHRPGLEELGIEHIADWLAKKREVGQYVGHDEKRVLDGFKDYCRANGKNYRDYVAALRGAFDWERFAPKQGGAYQRSSGPVSRGSSQNPDIQAMINAKREQESGN